MIKSREEIKNELINETMSCDREEVIRYLKGIANNTTMGLDNDTYTDPEDELRAEVAQEILKSLR